MKSTDKINIALTAAAKRRGVLGKKTGTVSMTDQRGAHKEVLKKLPGASKYRPLWMLALDETDSA